MSNPSQRNQAQASSSPKLLDRVRETLRRKHYSYRTEQAYIQEDIRKATRMGGQR